MVVEHQKLLMGTIYLILGSPAARGARHMPPAEGTAVGGWSGASRRKIVRVCRVRGGWEIAKIRAGRGGLMWWGALRRADAPSRGRTACVGGPSGGHGRSPDWTY